ncbi:6-bladed beta-propeller protein [Fodinibius roseus]|uniref:6-bladed beta-propeller protein n=1 Tax=Fodinibius roseus TaxID=1194090 RepID=A0A1M5K2T0_9BACT|nr:6-bladed beta-propeller [Fodinibius roseus]SHG47077.1 6-bladed beta-propeller protein [Fodinibius roseus]
MKLNILTSPPKLFWAAVYILLFAISGFVSDFAPEKLSLSFDESFSIGENTGADANYFLASPYQIRTDNRQNIYIAEGQQKTIMVFGPHGKHLRSIGRSGKGPGEFPSGPRFHFNNENKIVALDMVSQRVTWFSKKGDILSEYAPSQSGMVWSEKFFQTADGNYIMLKKPRDIGESDPSNYREYVFHRYSKSFEDHINFFGKFDRLVPKSDSKFVNMISNRINSGNFVKTGKNSFWYTPGIYDGKVYKFENSADEWKLVNTFDGYTDWEEAIVVNTEEDGSMSIVTYGEEGQQRSRGKINSYSIGLVQTNDGKVLHFSGQRMANKDSLKTMVEVFNPQGNLIGTGSFDEIAIDSNLAYFSSHDPAIWMDEKNRFYFVDYDDVPVVKVGKIEGL